MPGSRANLPKTGHWTARFSGVDFAGPDVGIRGGVNPVTRSVKWGAILLAIAALATIGLLVLGVRQSLGTSCEVCMTFQGRTACRAAVGPGEQEATTTAIQNACAFLAAGMTQTVQCQNRPPDSTVCERASP